MRLHNEQIYLRAMEPDDLDLLYRWENNTSLWQFGSTRSPVSRQALRRLIEEASSSLYEAGQQRWMIVHKITNCAAGCIDLFEYDHLNSRVGVGILVDDEFQRQGVASATLSLISEFLFVELDVNQLFAHVVCDNLPADSLFRRCGFVQSGVLKSWQRIGSTYQDVLILQKLR